MAPKKRIGRPPKSEEDRKAVNFTFRSRGQMRDLLKAAAAASGRSISEEIEYRLQNSFREDDSYGGPRLSAVFRVIANSIALLKTGGSLAETDRARGAIAQVFVDLLASEVPGFNAVAIETIGDHGESRTVVAYASEDARNRSTITEILMAQRAAAASRSTETEPPSPAGKQK
jgi:Arc-like DNA binding domain